MWPVVLDHFTRPQPFFISAPRSDLGWEVKVKTAATPHSTKTGGQRCLTILRDRNLLERQPGCLSMAFLSTCGRVRRLSARFFSSHLFCHCSLQGSQCQRQDHQDMVLMTNASIAWTIVSYQSNPCQCDESDENVNVEEMAATQDSHHYRSFHERLWKNRILIYPILDAE